MTPAHLIPSPLGDIAVRIEDDALTGLFFVGQKYYPRLAIAPGPDVRRTSPVARTVADEIAEYFAGARTTFSVPVHLRGTAFQRSVWKELLAIPLGTLVSYGELTARRTAGERRACRRWRGRTQPRVDHRAVPSRRRCVGELDRVCGRHRTQARVAVA